MCDVLFDAFRTVFDDGRWNDRLEVVRGGGLVRVVVVTGEISRIGEVDFVYVEYMAL